MADRRRNRDRPVQRQVRERFQGRAGRSIAATSSEAEASLTCRPGTPTTVHREGTSSMTTAPAPMMHSHPRVTFGMTVAPMPTKAPDSTLTRPPMRTPGQM